MPSPLIAEGRLELGLEHAVFLVACAIALVILVAVIRGWHNRFERRDGYSDGSEFDPELRSAGWETPEEGGADGTTSTAAPR